MPCIALHPCQLYTNVLELLSVCSVFALMYYIICITNLQLHKTIEGVLRYPGMHSEIPQNSFAAEVPVLLLL